MVENELACEIQIRASIACRLATGVQTLPSHLQLNWLGWEAA